MDNLARVNVLLHAWGDWVLDGKASPGVFGTSAWSEGKPVKAPKKPQTKRKRDDNPSCPAKVLVPQPVPHETRQVRPKIPCIRVAYREERIHKLVMSLPESALPVVCCLWVKKRNFGDTAMILGMTSKKVNEIKRESLNAINSML